MIATIIPVPGQELVGVWINGDPLRPVNCNGSSTCRADSKGEISHLPLDALFPMKSVLQLGSLT